MRARRGSGRSRSTAWHYQAGQDLPDVVALDAEVKNSTFADKFKAAYPDRFVDCYIAEQNMAGVALGLASEGKIPFASTFACFLTRAFDQIRMAGISKPKHLIFAGTHVGVSIARTARRR
jgi:transketolase